MLAWSLRFQDELDIFPFYTTQPQIQNQTVERRGLLTHPCIFLSVAVIMRTIRIQWNQERNQINVARPNTIPQWVPSVSFYNGAATSPTHTPALSLWLARSLSLSLSLWRALFLSLIVVTR